MTRATRPAAAPVASARQAGTTRWGCAAEAKPMITTREAAVGRIRRQIAAFRLSISFYFFRCDFPGNAA
eukprot:scaffold106517_cov33-Tisochrysis_lutea.AAC.1